MAIRIRARSVNSRPDSPRGSLHVVALEAILSNRQDEMHRITSFLGLEADGRPPMLAASNRQSYDPLGPVERRRLFSLFEDDIEQTSRLIEQDLPYHG